MPDNDDRSRMDRLDDPTTHRYVSGEELRGWLDPDPDWRIADCGSGTGRFTDEIAPIVETVYAVDIDPAMHAYYRRNGVPASVMPVLADMATMPFPSGALDGIVSIRTFHHGVADVLDELGRVLRPGGRIVIADWSRTATGLFGHDPNPAEHYDLATVQSMLLDHGFRIHHAEERWETFVVVADRWSTTDMPAESTA